MTDDVSDGWWVGATFQAAGGFARMEAGGVLADEGVARRAVTWPRCSEDPDNIGPSRDFFGGELLPCLQGYWVGNRG